MKKFFKILGIIVVSFIALIFLAAFIIPTFFKDDIKKLIDKSAEEYLKAEVFYDLDALHVSIIRNFPDISVGIDNIGVIGIDEFKGDTLASVGSFSAALDIMSLINGGEIKVNGVYLDKPYIHGIVNKAGVANWDIVKDTTTTPDEPELEEDTTGLDLSIQEVIITDGTIIYDDFLENTFAEIRGFNQTSSIDIEDVYTIFTHTSMKEISAEYGGVSYLEKNEFESKIDAVLDLENSSFTFKENTIRLNELVLAFDGNVSLPDTNTTSLDLTFQTKETTFKSILSLVPAVYLSDFSDLKTSGSFAFNGAVKGDLTEETIPAFDIKMLIKDGFFQYPDLPEAVSNVNLDLATKNESGILEETVIDLKQFHAELGKNPIDAKILVKNLRDYESVANLRAVVDLADVTKLFPMEGLTLKGILSANINAEGAYDSVNQQIPVVDATIGLKNGYVLSSEFPEPIEDLQVLVKAFTDGTMQNAYVDISKLNLKLQEEVFTANLYAKNFDNISYKADFHGIIDLDKILKIYPLEDMEMGGRITVKEFHTEGTMADVDAENYQALKTSGSAEMKAFHFTSPDLPQGIKIDNALMSFDPERIKVPTMSGYIGKSDYQISGDFSNYMGYLFSETDTIIKGKMHFYSSKFDVNEWMTEEEGENTEASDTTTLEAFPVPGNIDFVLDSKLDKVLYDNMEIDDLKGVIIVRDQRVTMQNIKFNTLDGDFDMDGYYDTKDITTPLYDFEMKMKNLSIHEAYNTFESIQEMAPIAEGMQGKFDMDIVFKGPMDSEMNPIYEHMNGKGTLVLHEAKIEKSEAMNKVAKALNQDLGELEMKNQKIAFEIINGKIVTNPFDLKAGDIAMTLSGTSTITGALDYLGEVKIPGGQVTKTLNAQLSQYGLNVGDDIVVDLAILGTFLEPLIKIKGSKNAGSLKDTKKELVNNAKEEVDKFKKEAEERARAEAERIKKETEAKARAEAERIKKEAEKRARAEADRLKKEAEEKAKKEAKKGLEGLFK